MGSQGEHADPSPLESGIQVLAQNVVDIDLGRVHTGAWVTRILATASVAAAWISSVVGAVTAGKNDGNVIVMVWAIVGPHR